MFTVALIGPDGAGKTTIARRLEHELPLPVQYVYMGVSLDSSNVMLPTTRLARRIKRALGAPPDTAGPRDASRPPARPRSRVKRFASEARAFLRLANRLSEEWYRQALTEYYRRRGRIVIFDRHFYSDYYAYDIAAPAGGRSLSSRIHGFMLERVYPKPDLVIYLDAPAEVLHARKGEGTVGVLERRRQDYMALQSVVKRFEVVDASRSEEDVANDVAQRIRAFYNESPRRR